MAVGPKGGRWQRGGFEPRSVWLQSLGSFHYVLSACSYCRSSSHVYAALHLDRTIWKATRARYKQPKQLQECMSTRVAHLQGDLLLHCLLKAVALLGFPGNLLQKWLQRNLWWKNSQRMQGESWRKSFPGCYVCCIFPIYKNAPTIPLSHRSQVDFPSVPKMFMS